MVEDFLGIGQTGGLNPDQIEVGVLRKRPHLRDQILETLAADAAAGDAAQFQLASGKEGCVDVDGAKIVDDNCSPFQRHVRMSQPMAQGGRLAAAEKSGQDDEGKGVGAHDAGRLPFAGIAPTLAQMYRLLALFFIVGVLSGLVGMTPALAAESTLGLGAKQMVVCLADNSSSSEGTLQLFHRDASGQWQADGAPWPVMFARGGLAWGRGINPPQPGPQKMTGDHRNPAGLFKIGFVMGYTPTLPAGAKGWPYHQVTDRDAWIDDPKLSQFPYNHLYTLPPGAPFPDWWAKEYMHLGDFAYEYLVLIEHNYDNPIPEAGNEIFFHVRRGEHYRTAGCTTMKLEDLEYLVKWLEPDSNAMVAELTRADYARFWQEWHLPPPQK